jgi:hypothetical protein
MKSALPIALMGMLATLVLTSYAVFADFDVDVSVDKRIVAPGGSIKIDAKIIGEGNTSGNSSGEFEYRIAAVAPARAVNGSERVVICDSGKQTTNSGNVSFVCDIPTLDELVEMGVSNAHERSVIPLKGGIAVMEVGTNETVKKHGKALIINTEKIKDKLENALARIDQFINKTQILIDRCDNITARAEEAGAENVIERCAKFQEKMQEKIDKALEAQERIQNILNNLNDPDSFDFDDLKGKLFSFSGHAKNFKVEVSDFGNFLAGARGELEKRVAKEISDRAREKADQMREEMKERQEKLRERIEEIKENRMNITESDEDENEEEDEEETEENETEENETESNSGEG